MICCLNPDCAQPQNPDGTKFCINCGSKLTPLLRGRYRIISRLANGGFGPTYLAQDIDKLNEPCVVKQLAPKVQGSWAQQKAIELFEQEAWRLQQLGKHSLIPTLYAYFKEDKYLYLVQQFINGQNLLQELEQYGAWNEQKIWEFLKELLPLLQWLHEQQVIHRDIKPENVIRRSPTSEEQAKEGSLVLIDFGAAKLATATALAKPGTTIGSFGYAPIEQIHGGEAYPASDLYSLGATCFHLLTNLHPWELWKDRGYGWVQSWKQHLHRPVSKDLEQVLNKLLQKDRQLRYQSATEVLEDLNRRQQSSLPPASQPIPSLEQNDKLRNKLLVVVSILLLGLAGTLIYGYLLDQHFPSAIKSLITSGFYLQRTLNGHSDEVYSLAFSPDDKTLASGSGDRTIKLWNFTTGKELKTLNGHGDQVLAVAFSPDGKTLASGSRDDNIKLWNVATGEEIRTLKGHIDQVLAVAFSPDGKTLASGSADKTIKLWNLDTGKEIITLKGHTANVVSVAYSPILWQPLPIKLGGTTTPNGNSPDGFMLASGSGDHSIKLWNASTGQEIRTLDGHSDSVAAVAFSPDGRTLASGSWDKTIKLWNVATGQETRTLYGHNNSVAAVAFSPDGKTLASGSWDEDETIKLWEISTGKVIRNLNPHSDSVVTVAFSPDGKTLASGSRDHSIKIWRVK